MIVTNDKRAIRRAQIRVISKIWFRGVAGFRPNRLEHSCPPARQSRNVS